MPRDAFRVQGRAFRVGLVDRGGRRSGEMVRLRRQLGVLNQRFPRQVVEEALAPRELLGDVVHEPPVPVLGPHARGPFGVVGEGGRVGEPNLRPDGERLGEQFEVALGASSCAPKAIEPSEWLKTTLVQCAWAAVPSSHGERI